MGVALPLPKDSAAVYVQALFEDRRQHVWVGTRDRGLFDYDPATNRFTRMTRDARNPSSLPDTEVRAVVEDASGTLWIGADGAAEAPWQDFGLRVRKTGANYVLASIQNEHMLDSRQNLVDQNRRNHLG